MPGSTAARSRPAFAEITSRDDTLKRVQARGWLLVGTKVLYAMEQFTLLHHPRGGA